MFDADFEVIDTIAVGSVEEADMIVHNDEVVSVNTVFDNGDMFRIEATNMYGDSVAFEADPFADVLLVAWA